MVTIMKYLPQNVNEKATTMDWDNFESLDQECEYAFMCPHCWQQITMLIDTSVRQQTYIEDCEVCCNPIMIHYEAERDGFIAYFEARRSA